eukprot:2045535-Heterocapsa_arctica.AAC.1
MPGSKMRIGFLTQWVTEDFPSGALPPSVDGRFLHAASFRLAVGTFPGLGASIAKFGFPSRRPGATRDNA